MLWGSVADAPPEDAVWLVDGKESGNGVDAWVTLDPGEHTVVLRIGRADAARVTVAAARGDEERPLSTGA
jgi:hypothetical protein